MKIIVTENFILKEDQIERIKSLGETVFLQTVATSKEESIERLSNADIICAESKPIIDIVYNLKNKLISFPFVGVGWLDLEKLAKNNVRIANAPGCDKKAVSEWVSGMMIILSRKLLKYINIEKINPEDVMESMPGLAGKKVAILGKGNIGLQVGKVCEAFDMKATYFKRGDDLKGLVSDVDFVVNCLARNKETTNLLNRDFFQSFKKGAFFLSVTDSEIYDADALIEVVDGNHLAGVAIDPAGIGVFNTESEAYSKLRQHPEIIVTPHIAFHNDMTIKMANDIMINNVEAWIKGNPINLVN